MAITQLDRISLGGCSSVEEWSAKSLLGRCVSDYKGPLPFIDDLVQKEENDPEGLRQALSSAWNLLKPPVDVELNPRVPVAAFLQVRASHQGDTKLAAEFGKLLIKHQNGGVNPSAHRTEVMAAHVQTPSTPAQKLGD